MPTWAPAYLLLGQALVERGLLDSMAAGLAHVRYRLELYIGEGNAVYLLAAAVIVLVVMKIRLRR